MQVRDGGDLEPALKVTYWASWHHHRRNYFDGKDSWQQLRCDFRYWNYFVVELPFPSLSTAPNRFHCNENDFFSYQAQSELKCLWEKVKAFWLNGKSVSEYDDCEYGGDDWVWQVAHIGCVYIASFKESSPKPIQLDAICMLYSWR